MNKSHAISAIKFGVAILIFLCVYLHISKIVSNTETYNYYQNVAGFYEERENSLDAVYLGASHVYAYFEAPIAWHKAGITVFPYSTGAQPLAAVPYLIEDIKKTQPNALIIVNINELTYPPSATRIHFLTDYMPISWTKVRLIHSLCNWQGEEVEGSLEFLQPFIRFHSRWCSLTKQDFHYEIDGLKGAQYYESFLNETMNVSDGFLLTTSKESLSDYCTVSLNNILDYCDEAKVNILFVVVPQCRGDKSIAAQYNYAQELIEKRGYTVLNLEDYNYINKIGLDFTKDYYDHYHTNIHGALKYSAFLAMYLVENYNFEDKRSDLAYADWDEAYDKYKEIIAPYLTEKELAQLS